MVEDGQVISVMTCPLCLPPGAITWLIENGRQLDMFSDSGVLPVAGRQCILDSQVSVSGLDEDEASVVSQDSDLPF